MCAATADRISLKCEENSSFCLVRYQKIRTYLCDFTQIDSRKDYILHIINEYQTCFTASRESTTTWIFIWSITKLYPTPRTAQSAMTLWGEWGLTVPITKLEAVSNVPRLCQISAICPGCGVAGGCQLLPRPAPGRVMECWVSQHCSLRGL